MSAPPRRGEHSPATLCRSFTVFTKLVVSLKTTNGSPCCWLRLPRPLEKGFELDLRHDAPWKAPEMKTWSLTREVYGRGRCEGGSCSMMIKAMNTITKERLLTNRVAGQFVFQPLPPDRPARSTFGLCILTLALGCTMSPICTSNSTGELLLMECSHPALPVAVVSEFPRRWLQLRRKLSTRCSLLLGRVSIQVPSVR